MFWTLTSKNPNKSVRDYHERFAQNMPMPVVNEGELTYTFEGPKVYFNVVNEIIKLDKQVHYDNPDFLKLVTDNIQIFERHWRKMVHDIREGKLDRKLSIPTEMRKIFETTNIPRPQLATNLDKTFRMLGFHNKVLGKDITISKYAELKRQPQSVVVASKRKRSLPIASMSSSTTMNMTSTSGSNSGFNLNGIRSIMQAAVDAVNNSDSGGASKSQNTGASTTSPHKSSTVSGGAALTVYAASALEAATIPRAGSRNLKSGQSKQQILSVLKTIFCVDSLQS